MIKKAIEKAINDQINAELFSSYLYLSMAAYFESIDLPGGANWFRVQAQEELVHALKFYDFVVERDGRVRLTQVAAPETEWDSPVAAFDAALAHERGVTERINKLVDLALKHSDHATNNFLQWFVAEQVEEEASADAVARKLKRIGADGAGMFMLDQELGARVFTPPAATTPA
jgi:ferritin